MNEFARLYSLLPHSGGWESFKYTCTSFALVSIIDLNSGMRDLHTNGIVAMIGLYIVYIVVGCYSALIAVIIASLEKV